MREVALAKDHIAFVDDEDHTRITAYRWIIKVTKLALGNEYVRAFYWCGNRAIYMHHEVLHIIPWELNGMEIDHIDRNPLNNCKANLRIVTHRENSHNSGDAGRGKGVSYNFRAKLYMAYLDRLGQRRSYLGYFKTREAALAAVEKARCL